MNKGLLIGVAIAMTMVIGTAGLDFWNTRQLDINAAWVTHTHEVLGRIATIEMSLMQAESMQRSFLATKNEAMLEPYLPALARLAKNRAELQDLTSDNPRQQVRCSEIEILIATYLTHLQDGIEQRRQGMDEAQAILTTTAVRQKTIALRQTLADMEREERMLLEEREQQSRKAYGIAVTSGVIAAAVGLSLIVLLLWLLERSLRARRTAEELIQRENAVLEDRVEMRTTQLRNTTAALSRSDIDLSGSEQMLRQSEGRLEELTAHIHQVLWMIDAQEARVLYVSPAYEAMWGRSCQSLLDNRASFMDGVHPLDQERVRRDDNAMYETGLIDSEYRVVHPDGSICWVWSRGYPLFERGRVVRIVGVIEDITEKRRLAGERETLLSRLLLHIQRMPLAYILCDADMLITDWNPTAERIFGFTRSEMLGTGPPYEKFTPPESWEAAKVIHGRIHGGDMEAHSINDNLTKDGRTITCQWFNTPLMDDNGQFLGVLCLAQDITEQKSLEAQFHQAQKMEAFGQLAGGVAHDFNNLLTVISGYSEIILARLGADDPMRASIVAINVAGERATSLTRQLLAFSRKTVLEPKVLDLNTVVRDIEKLLHRLIGEDILLTAVLDPRISSVKVDPDQLGQILMNLAINARDAMPKGGRLTLETRDAELDAGYARLHPEVKPGPYVLLSVSDTGSGMTPDVLARVFEPFFTTKGIGKGTGLGLAVVLGIVKQSAGYVAVYSEPDFGTSFKVYLPAVGEKVAATDGIEAQIGAHGTETVLVVEDEEGVRSLAVLILESYSYRVLAAGSGDEALHILREHLGCVDLLLTDVVMPGMGGPDLAEILRPLFPQMKVLYCSGYTDDAVVRHGILHEAVAFLQKPYTPPALARKVREVLDKPRGAARATLASHGPDRTLHDLANAPG